MVREILKVAVVIPVYNVESYLKECLDSILAQTYANFTVFAVDDGSTDRSGLILDEYARKDSRIHVMHKRNGGVSSARNFGIAAVERCGVDYSYLYFIDGDDVIPANFIRELVYASERTQAEMAICSVCGFDKVDRYQKREPTLYSRVLDCDEFSKLYFGLSENVGTSIDAVFLCNKLFKFSADRKFRFREDLSHAEDIDFIVSCVMPTLSKVAIVLETSYFYRLRKSSLSHANAILQDFESFSALVRDINKYTASARRGIQNRYIASLYRELLYAFSPNGDAKKREVLIEKARAAAVKKWEFELDFKSRRRLFISYLPRSIIAMCSKNRFRESKKLRKCKNYYD